MCALYASIYFMKTRQKNRTMKNFRDTRVLYRTLQDINKLDIVALSRRLRHTDLRTLLR